MLSYHRQRPSFTPTVSSSESSPPRKETPTAHKWDKASGSAPTFPNLYTEHRSCPLSPDTVAIGHLYPVITDLSDWDDAHSRSRCQDADVAAQRGDRTPHGSLTSRDVLSESWTCTALQTPQQSRSTDGSSATSHRTSSDDEANVKRGLLHRRQRRRRHDRSSDVKSPDVKPRDSNRFRSHSEEASAVLRDAHDFLYREEREPQPAVRFADSYVLTRLIFQCEQSSVWECVHRSSGERYCVKIMETSSTANETTAQYEAAMLQAAQSHPSVLGLVEVIQEDPTLDGRDVADSATTNSATRQRHRTRSRSSMSLNKSGKLYLVMEWMSGGNLLSFVVQNGSLDEPCVQRIALQLLQAVDHLHSVAYLSHNDLHPANILLGRQTSSPSRSLAWDTVKIADFGSAAPLRSNDSNTSRECTHRPLTPRRYRTVAMSETTPPVSYRAPELKQSHQSGMKSMYGQRSSHNGSGTADMWSIGAILYFCLLGHSDTESSSCSSLVDTNLLAPSWSRLSRHAKQFLTALLDEDPTVRLTVREALQHPWLAGVATPIPVPPPIRTSTPLSSVSVPPASSAALITDVPTTLWTKAVHTVYSKTMAWPSFNMECFKNRVPITKQVDAPGIPHRRDPAPSKDLVAIPLSGF